MTSACCKYVTVFLLFLNNPRYGIETFSKNYNFRGLVQSVHSSFEQNSMRYLINK